MGEIKVTGLNVIAFYVSDLEASTAFYMDKLGFETCEFDMDPGVLLKSEDVTIYLEEGRVKKEGDRGMAEVCPCFATESIKESYTKLQSANVEIFSEYVEYAPTFGMFRILDLDGNLIEFAGKP